MEDQERAAANGEEDSKHSSSPTHTSHNSLANPTKILKIGNFRLGKTIGVGSFGKVKSNYRCQHSVIFTQFSC
jgi:hypothetical protein